MTLTRHNNHIDGSPKDDDTDKYENGTCEGQPCWECEHDAIEWRKDHLGYSKRDSDRDLTHREQHARHELELQGLAPNLIYNYMRVIKAYAAVEYTSDPRREYADTFIQRIANLIKFEHLGDLTDNPDEWTLIGTILYNEDMGVWQNLRNPRAFSHDHGEHYYMLDARGRLDGATQTADNHPNGPAAVRERLRKEAYMERQRQKTLAALEEQTKKLKGQDNADS